MESIYREDFDFCKAGVHLLELQPASTEQDVFDDVALGGVKKDHQRLMQVMDGLNARYGRGTLVLAGGGLPGQKHEWSTRQKSKIPEYTTRLEDIPIALA